MVVTIVIMRYRIWDVPKTKTNLAYPYLKVADEDDSGKFMIEGWLYGSTALRCFRSFQSHGGKMQFWPVTQPQVVTSNMSS